MMLFLFVTSLSYGKSPYAWQVFNIHPFGSENRSGIGFDLVNAYAQAGLENQVIVTNTSRWQIDMTNPDNFRFCTSGSWKLPNTQHRIYSNSIVNTVDYGVAVRAELYEALTHGGQVRIIDLIEVVNSTRTQGKLLIMKGRPVFGKMGQIIAENSSKDGINVEYMTASEGPVSMLKMATIENRRVSSVLVFPEEFSIFTRMHPKHSLKYLMLSEGSNFAPIRASCPDTEEGRRVVSAINRLLDDGLRQEALNWFLDALPDIPEIREQARVNQRCIQDASCTDPLTD